ncbi:hypothetical protein EYZ11_008848 [Aspergillus tanneri]|uniref:GED domain-containing protein n=1 Tax=Aspergillus tanneri TaxID=1220188 RepID=A0A4S3J9F8_9EURO|nr:hypothetical protein EYZ11_008848 [Aspergillus tanneri]
MDSSSFDTAGLTELGTAEQQILLDKIDSLRVQGVGEFVDLPQIVVCGDQSSGKSSVLEALSGVPFPRSDTLLPGSDVSKAGSTRLRAFKANLQRLDGFTDLVERAKAEMGVSTTGKAFSSSILRVEISGPNQPTLTVVDLPGFIHSGSNEQPSTVVKLVSDMVGAYMENPRSIILAVVSAKNDYANQIVLSRAREVDPDGLRTLGLITKPDELRPGSGTEADFIDLASNNKITFRLGWHIVKNRDYDESHYTTVERGISEEQFFATSAWKQMPHGIVGITSLRKRLCKILLGRIKRYLPKLTDDLQSSIVGCKTKLDKLGDSRDTIDDQRRFLLRLSQSFQTLCRAAIDGKYEHAFFADPSSNGGYSKRLRAAIQNSNLEFAKRMQNRGYYLFIKNDDEGSSDEDSSDDDSADDDSADDESADDDSTDEDSENEGFEDKEYEEGYVGHYDEDVQESTGDNDIELIQNIQHITMTREEAIEWVRQLLVRSRGRELPGLFDPILVGELFRYQSINWEIIARNHVKKAWEACKKFIELLLNDIGDEEATEELLALWVDPIIYQRFEDANKVLDHLLIDRSRNPITYNQYYTETLQHIREQRQMREFQQRIQQHLGGRPRKHRFYINVAKLSRALSQQSKADMDSFACSELLDSMQAYYKVALSTFVDNVCVQVIERILVADLCSIFSPIDVAQMDSELISKIAAPSSESQALRQQLARKMKTLDKGLRTCKHYFRHRSAGREYQLQGPLGGIVNGDSVLPSHGNDKPEDEGRASEEQKLLCFKFRGERVLMPPSRIYIVFIDTRSALEALTNPQQQRLQALVDMTKHKIYDK